MSITPWHRFHWRQTGASGIASSSSHRAATNGRPTTSWPRPQRRHHDDAPESPLPGACRLTRLTMAVADEQRLITPISQREFELYALSLDRGPNFDPAHIFASYQAGRGRASGCILLDPEGGA